MASNLLTLHLENFRTTNPSVPYPLSTTFLQSLPFPTYHRHGSLSLIPSNLLSKDKISALTLNSSLSSSIPPSSKEEAIRQAKTCLLTSLEKPLNNPKLAGKLKTLKQPRFRIEIPVNDDSPSSLAQLAVDVFRDLRIKIKGSPVKILIVWPDITLTEAAVQAFESLPSKLVDNVDFTSLNSSDDRIWNTADVIVFLAPETSQLGFMETVAEASYPKPVVIFNPRWAFEEEINFDDFSGFIRSFEVIYSFMGLEVKGILSKRTGVIFKCVRDGVLSGERWNVLVEEEGELKVVSKFKARPSIYEVESVLYNIMAMNSPITKSAKFLKDLVSNVPGKR